MVNKTMSNLQKVTRVSNLKEATTISNGDVLLVETATETLKVTKENLLKEINQQLNTKSDLSHTHSEYMTESSLNNKGLATETFVTNKITQEIEKTNAQLNTKSDLSHTHNEYVTESSLNNKGLATETFVTNKITQEIEKTNAQLSVVRGKINNVDVVADIKSLNAKNGELIKTCGFYSIGDGGHATYKVVNDFNVTENDSTVFKTNNGKYATLIHDGTIRARKIGCKINDETFDNKNCIYSAIAIGCKIIQFESGVYTFSEMLLTHDTMYKETGIYNLPRGVFLKGANPLTYSELNVYSTLFKPLNHGQDYIIKLGGNDNFTKPETSLSEDVCNMGIIDIGFSDKGHKVSKACLCIEYCYSSRFSLGFYECDGRSLYMRNVWELDFDDLIIRKSTFDQELVLIDEILMTDGANTSRLRFNNIDLERNGCTFIHFKENCIAGNIYMNTISYEPDFSISFPTIVQNPPTDPKHVQTLSKVPLFNIGFIDGLTINQINLAGMGKRTFKKDYTNETIDSLFNIKGFANIAIGTINNNDGSNVLYFGTGNSHPDTRITIQSLTSSFKNRASYTIYCPRLFYINTIEKGFIRIDNNDFVIYNLAPVNTFGLGKMYDGSYLIGLTNYNYNSKSLVYDPPAVNQYVIKKEKNDFRSWFSFDTGVECKMILRIKTHSDCVYMRKFKSDGSGESTTVVPIPVNDGVTYNTVVIPIERTNGYEKFILTDKNDETTVGMSIDYVCFSL